MRIHSNLIRADKVRDALAAEKAAGRIAPHVTFKVLHECGSRSHAFAVEIQLEAAIRDNGRRAGNSGAYGAMIPEVDGYAATFDEWGWLLAALFGLDPAMIVGTPKNPVYRDRSDFDNRTSLTYTPAALIHEIETSGDPYPYITGRAAKTKRGYFIGRRGADRESTDRYGLGVYRPRTVADVVEFARLTEAVAS